MIKVIALAIKATILYLFIRWARIEYAVYNPLHIRSLIFYAIVVLPYVIGLEWCLRKVMTWIWDPSKENPKTP